MSVPSIYTWMSLSIATLTSRLPLKPTGVVKTRRTRMPVPVVGTACCPVTSEASHTVTTGLVLNTLQLEPASPNGAPPLLQAPPGAKPGRNHWLAG